MKTNGFKKILSLLGLICLTFVVLAARPQPFSVKVGAILPGHPGGITALGFAVKSPLLASGGKDGTLSLWDVEMERQKWSKKAHGGEVVACAFCGSDAYIISASKDKSLILRDARTGNPVREFKGLKGAATALAVNWDGQSIAVASKKIVYLFDIKTGTKLGELKGHKKDVVALGFSIDGDKITSVGKDKRIILWNVNTKKKIRNIEETANELYSASFNNETTVYFLGVKNLQFSRQGFTTAGDSGVGGVKEDDFIQVRDGGSGVDLGRLKGHDGTIRSLAISPDLNYIASVADDKTFRVYSLAQNAEVAEFGNPDKMRAAAFSPLGKWIATGGDEGKIYIYNCLGVSQFPRVVLRGDRIFKIPPLPPYAGKKSNLAVFPIKTDNARLKKLVRPVTDALRSEFVNAGRHTVIDRANMERIAAEVRACQAGYLKAGCSEEMQVKGIEHMVTGSMSYMGKKIVLNLQLIDTGSGEIAYSATEQAIITEEDLDLLARSVVYQICARIR